MGRFKAVFAVALLFGNVAGLFALAVQEHPAMNFKPIMRQAMSLDPASTLLVFDIDNTLLQRPAGKPLGSAQWFNWQSDLINKTEKGKSVAASESELINDNACILRSATFRPTESDLPADFLRLNALKYHLMALTARGCELESATLHQLKVNHLVFDHSPGGKGITGSFLPKVSHARPACYTDGVMFVAGQSKGLMLVDLLQRTHFSPKNIIFVDDADENIVNVVREFNLPDFKNIQVYAYRYAGSDARVAKFNQKNSKPKRIAAKQWAEFSK